MGNWYSFFVRKLSLIWWVIHNKSMVLKGLKLLGDVQGFLGISLWWFQIVRFWLLKVFLSVANLGWLSGSALISCLIFISFIGIISFLHLAHTSFDLIICDEISILIREFFLLFFGGHTISFAFLQSPLVCLRRMEQFFAHKVYVNHG